MVASVVKEVTGSSICGAVDEVNAVSESFSVTAGEVSVEVLAGLVLSFLLKKLPNIEVLLADLGAAPAVVVPVAGSVAAAGSVGALVVPVVPLVSAAAVSPLVNPVAPAAEGSEAPEGSTGAPMTRAADGH